MPNSFVYIDLESVVNGCLIKEEEVCKEDAPSRAQRTLVDGDILYQMVRPYQKNNLYFEKKGDYVASTGYAQIRTLQNSRFIFQHLHNQKFVDRVIEKCTGTSYPAINSTDLGSIQVYVPSLPEQAKIASFLSLIDERISTQSKIIEALKELKASLSKQIFSRKLRFKDENGDDFPEWEEKKLGEIGSSYNGLSGKNKEHFGSGVPYIQYKQVFDNSTINTTNCELVEINNTENQNRVMFGDVFFTVSSETPNEVGMSSVLLEDVNEMYLNSFCFGYRAYSSDILDPFFSRYLFRSDTVRNDIIKLAQGSTRYNMSKSQFLKLSIFLPSSVEQKMIASTLSAIDSKIEVETKTHELLTKQKQYILRQMFI